jgi:two-component system phosphate regulon response regulator PhoB
MHLLLVEDDLSLGETLKERLHKEGYEITWVETQKLAFEKIEKIRFDLIILDVGLPDGSGFELARKVKATRDTPFIFVTAMNSAEHRLQGYEIGAHEFIPKPFHLKELLMRVRHVLSTHSHADELVVSDRKIDFQSRAVIGPSGDKEFPPGRDFDLLKLLIDRAVSRDEILDEIWGEEKFPSHRTIDNSVVRLRQILGDQGAKMIRSVRGVGYQWRGDDSAADENVEKNIEKNFEEGDE